MVPEQRKFDVELERKRKQWLTTAIEAVGDTHFNAPTSASLPQTISVRIANVGARALVQLRPLHNRRGDRPRRCDPRRGR